MPQKVIKQIVLLVALAGVSYLALAQEQLTLKDLGQLDSQIEFAKKKKTLADEQKGAGRTANAGAVSSADIAPIAAPPKPRVVKPATLHYPVGIRLRAVFGVNERLTAVFIDGQNHVMRRAEGESVDGWRVAGIRKDMVDLSRGKDFYAMRIDPPVAIQADGFSDGPAPMGNAVTAAPLGNMPNPNIRAISPTAYSPPPSAYTPMVQPMTVSTPAPTSVVIK